MRMTFSKLPMIVALMLYAAPTFAQEGPSYAETLTFLRSKVDLNYGKTKTIRLVQNKKCNLTQATRLLAGFDGVPEEQSINVTFELSAIDPSRIEYRKSTNPGFPNDGYVLARTKELQKVIRTDANSYFSEKPTNKKWKCGARNMCRITYVGEDIGFQILQPNHDNGPRVVRALQHLVKLCGGKEELF